MNPRFLVLAGAIAVGCAGGCSTTGTGPAVDDDDKVYVTGSRIPKTDRGSAGVKATDDQDAIRSMMKPPISGGGGGK